MPLNVETDFNNGHGGACFQSMVRLSLYVAAQVCKPPRSGVGSFFKRGVRETLADPDLTVAEGLGILGVVRALVLGEGYGSQEACLCP